MPHTSPTETNWQKTSQAIQVLLERSGSVEHVLSISATEAMRYVSKNCYEGLYDKQRLY